MAACSTDPLAGTPAAPARPHRGQTAPAATDADPARAIDVCVGRDHTCAVDDDGRVFCWGANDAHQVGPFDAVQTSRATRVPGVGRSRRVVCAASTSCAVTTDGQAWCWGAGSTSDEASAAPRIVPFAPGVRDLALSSAGPCAIEGDGRVRCIPWRASRPEPIAVPAIEGATGFLRPSADPDRVCVRRATRPTLCFDVVQAHAPKTKTKTKTGVDTRPGRDERVPSLDFRDVREVVERAGQPPGGAAPRSGHVCTLREDGRIGCSGRATSGQLGDGVPYVHGPARVPDLDDATSLSVGDGGACAVRRSGELVCWGRHAAGDPPAVMRVVPTPFRSDEVAIGESLLDPARICAREADSEIWRCLFGAEWLEIPRRVRGPSGSAVRLVGRPKPALLDAEGGTWSLELRGPPTKTFYFSQVGLPVVALGHDGACAVDREGAVACGHCGACARPRDALTRIVAEEPFVLVGSLPHDEARGSTVCAVTRSGAARCYEVAAAPFVRAEPKPLPIAGLPSGVVDISSSGGRYAPNLTCVRTERGDVHCFGDARSRPGGAAPSSMTAQRVQGLPPVVGVGTGGRFACAREVAGPVWCWGDNRDGGAPDGAPLSREDERVVDLR